MNHTVLWLSHLGIEDGLMTREQCIQVRDTVGPAAELEDFAQRLIDDGHVENLEALEQLAGVALVKAKKGPPPSNPFIDAAVQEEITDSFAQPKRAEFAAPEFPFEVLANLSDSALADGFRELLRSTARYGASDLHLSTGARPFVRKNREFEFLSEHVLTAEESQRLNTALLNAAQKKAFETTKDLDYALACGSRERYRVNLMVHKSGVAGAYRMVPHSVRTLLELGFATNEPTLLKLLSYHNGLVLITGPVGSGKTTTLASMVAYLNEERTDHIITVEDPIEVVQQAKGCNVTQREVGPHTKSFAAALKGALREDPDVIVIGELRDLATIEMAITASETGHLVIGTMHTSDAATTLNRLLDVFPAGQQPQIRASVAESLRGVVCQRLLPASKGGLLLACEILLNNAAISSLIREGKTTGLRNTMETSARDGMCLMDNVVYQLYQQGKISAETALSTITNRVLRAKIS